VAARDEREEQPVDDILRSARVSLGDRLRRDRDEAAGIRERSAGADDRDNRRRGDLAHLRDHSRDPLRVRRSPGQDDHDTKNGRGDGDIDENISVVGDIIAASAVSASSVSIQPIPCPRPEHMLSHHSQGISTGLDVLALHEFGAHARGSASR
jgi:hypothetical protein